MVLISLPESKNSPVYHLPSILTTTDCSMKSIDFVRSISEYLCFKF